MNDWAHKTFTFAVAILYSRTLPISQFLQGIINTPRELAYLKISDHHETIHENRSVLAREDLYKHPHNWERERDWDQATHSHTWLPTQTHPPHQFIATTLQLAPLLPTIYHSALRKDRYVGQWYSEYCLPLLVCLYSTFLLFFIIISNASNILWNEYFFLEILVVL